MTHTLDSLKKQLEETDDLFERMDLQDKIREVEISLGHRQPVKPIDSNFECVGCGS